MKNMNLSKSELIFKSDTHEYFIGKKRIPSVSEILKKVGLSKDYSQIDPFFRDRGIATHKCIELHLKGILDEKSIDLSVLPSFQAFLAYWKGHCDPTLCTEGILAFEKPMADKAGLFAGTPDLVTDRAIYDWKCSKSHDHAAELQGAAYQSLAMDNGFPFLPFIIVELHDDGTFAEFICPDNHRQWEAVLMLYHWRMR